MCWWSGRGRPGLSAAIAAAEAGASVVVLDERSAAGGQYAKPLAPSYRDTAPDAQALVGDALRARAAKAGVAIRQKATVWGGFAADEIAAVVDGRAVTFRPRRLVIAAGAHEAPVALPGWTLPGVMTTGAVQTLVRTQRVLPSTAGLDRRERAAEPAIGGRDAARGREAAGGDRGCAAPSAGGGGGGLADG